MEQNVEEEFNPWERVWDSAKKAFVEAKESIKTSIEAVKEKPPWEWTAADFKKEKKPAALPMPSPVDVRTEDKMKKAAVIQAHERMPDTQSVSSNLQEIDAEIAREMKKKDPSKTVLDILQEEKTKFMKVRVR